MWRREAKKSRDGGHLEKVTSWKTTVTDGDDVGEDGSFTRRRPSLRSGEKGSAATTADASHAGSQPEPREKLPVENRVGLTRRWPS